MSHLITCPECTKHLQVPDELIGKKVQCPECKHAFVAKAEVETVSVSTKPSATSKSSPAPPPPPPPKKKAAWDSKDDEEEEESEKMGDDAYDVKKKKRSRDDDDDDDDDDGRSRKSRRRKRSSYRSHYMPHRGGMILAFGIIALVSGLGFIFGPIAWIMGNNDMRDIQSGRMDPEGEGMTQTGRVLGMISAILWIVALLTFFLFFGTCMCIPFIAAIGAAGQQRRR